MTSTGGAANLRLKLRGARAGIDPEDAKWWSNLAARAVMESPRLDDVDTLAGYLAFGREADPIAAMIWAWHQGKRVYVPVLNDGKMCFAPWHPEIETYPNSFGIAEPVHETDERIPAARLDLVLTPLVAFDDHGNRMGMGGGYYDRAFAFLTGEKRPTRPLMVGFGYCNQQQPSLPMERWDVPLDAAVTEAGWHDFAGQDIGDA